MARSKRPKVGYKNPPVASRFRPGVSGNPRGRPKGSKGFAALLRKELRARIDVNGRSGGQQKMSKERIMAAQLVNSAIREPKFIPTIMKLMGLEAEGDGESPAEAFVSDRPEDKIVIDNIVRRIRLGSESPPAEPVSNAENPNPKDSE